jgi:putative sigma-54 modulation protein
MVSGSSLTVHDERGLRIVAQEGNFLPKPMSVEDAAQHLDLLKADVLMFVNQDTNQPSVVFRQQDGNVGFTEPVSR